MVRVWWQVKLCDFLVTHAPYLNALEMHHHKALYKIHVTLLLFTSDVRRLRKTLTYLLIKRTDQLHTSCLINAEHTYD